MLKVNLSGHNNTKLEEMSFVFPGTLQVDLADPDLPKKVVDFLKSIPNLDGSQPVTIALPGLAPLSAIVIASVHGLTGSFPTIQPMMRTEEGFVPAPPIDLQSHRNNVARVNRKATVIL